MNKSKAFNIRMPKEMWSFLKKDSADREKSMNDIIISCIEKYKKKKEKDLTVNGMMVS